VAEDDLAPLREAARKNKVTVVCGIDERDTDFSRSTIYNSVVTIGPDGTILNRHRKVMPTNPERMVWGFGDASGLRAIETPCGRIGTLICWENYMPLARCALYAQGVDIYIAPTYDTGDRWIATMRHIAREGGCWVLGSGCAFQARHIPDAVPGKAELYSNADEWVNAGDSVVVAPGGKIVAGPLHNELGILYADIDLERVGVARRSLDTRRALFEARHFSAACEHRAAHARRVQCFNPIGPQLNGQPVAPGDAPQAARAPPELSRWASHVKARLYLHCSNV
jgi:nitrilase